MKPKHVHLLKEPQLLKNGYPNLEAKYHLHDNIMPMQALIMQSTSKRGAKKLHMNQILITSIIKNVKRCQRSSFDGDPIYILTPEYSFCYE